MLPFTANDPVTVTLPVNSCVLVNKLPNLVDPVTNSTDDVIVCTTNLCAVIVPVDVMSPSTIIEPVWKYEPVNEIISISAENNVPGSPIIPTDPVIPNDPVIWTDCDKGLT